MSHRLSWCWHLSCCRLCGESGSAAGSLGRSLLWAWQSAWWRRRWGCAWIPAIRSMGCQWQRLPRGLCLLSFAISRCSWGQRLFRPCRTGCLHWWNISMHIYKRRPDRLSVKEEVIEAFSLCWMLLFDLCVVPARGISYAFLFLGVVGFNILDYL